MSGKHIVITVNAAWNLWNYRTGLIRMLLDAGHRVTLLAPGDDTVPALTVLGCTFHEINMTRRGRAPHSEAAVLMRLHHALKRLKPDAVLSFTIKNNIYAGLSCRWLGIPFFPNVSGRGAVFGQHPAIVRGVLAAYRLAFGKAATVFYQNPEDRAFFLEQGIGQADRAALLPGSGVDLERFRQHPLPGNPEAPVFLMVARLLKDKGVQEYAQAATQVQKQWPKARFLILGAHEAGSDYVAASDLAAWTAQAVLEYPGTVPDIRPMLIDSDVVVLPSYYLEGTPRALIEAAATGRPIVTTDTAGCRDTLVEGKTGFLVPPRDAQALSAALLRIIDLGPKGRTEMGDAARQLAEERFDENIIQQIYADALAKAWT